MLESKVVVSDTLVKDRYIGEYQIILDENKTINLEYAIDHKNQS